MKRISALCGLLLVVTTGADLVSAQTIQYTFSPTDTTIGCGDTLVVDVGVDTITDLLGYSLQLNYDSTVVSPVYADTVGLVASAPCGSFFRWLSPGSNDGTVRVDLAMLQCTITGSGDLFRVKFVGLKSGANPFTSTLTTSGTMRDSNNETIPFSDAATPPTILSDCNHASVALCQDVTVPSGQTCPVPVNASQVDDGSFDPDGDPITLTLEPSGPYPNGMTFLNLIVSDGSLTDTCAATITVDCQEGTVLTCEDYESGFTLGEMVGSNADWFDGGNGPVVLGGVGVNGSVGLADGTNILTWISAGFDWNDLGFDWVVFQMDFESNSEGIGGNAFNGDRVGWMITDNNSSSDNIFGVQIDDPENKIEAYWDGVGGPDRRPLITTWSPQWDTWYRLWIKITKLTALSARLDVTVHELASDGTVAVANVAGGTITDTSLLGDDAPDTKYFTASEMWPGFKNSATVPTDGAADNACYEVALTPRFTVTTTAVPVAGGTVTLIPDLVGYEAGDTVIVTAVPADATWEFVGWSGDLMGSENPDTLVISGDATVIATFAVTSALACEDYESGFTLGEVVGSSADWFDGGSGPVVLGGVGVNGSVGLADGTNIFTWTSEGFSWTDWDFEWVVFQMDFESNSEGIGGNAFNGDRVGWMISDNNSSSDNIFGVQFDDPENKIEAYWDGVGGPDSRPLITTWSPKRDTWYRLWVKITKLTALSARLDVTVHELASDGTVAVADVAGGTITDTSLLGDDAPDTKYFTASEMWPGFKNSATEGDGAADNACYALSKRVPTGVGDDPVPLMTALLQNAPNPLNPTTTIGYTLVARGWVSLRVYDVRGRLVRTLVDMEKEPGTHAERWDGRNDRGEFLATGVYFYRLRAGKTVLTRRAVLFK